MKPFKHQKKVIKTFSAINRLVHYHIYIEK